MWIEIACACALLYGLISGWKNGLFEELVSAGGFLIGLGVAYIYFKTVGCNVWTFIIITLGTPLVLGILATFFTKVLDQVPVAGFLNRLLGALLGCSKWALVAGLILLLLGKFDPVKQYLSSLFHSVYSILV